MLPFANLSRDQENEYFSDGLAEELLNMLAKIRGLRVAARTSSFHFKGKQPTIAEVGRALNVATVLEGSVRRAGNRVRITVQLVNVADGYHLWSETYERGLDDIFAVQDEVARAVVDSLPGELLVNRDGLGATRGTRDRAAYDAYLEGRFFWNKRTEAETRKAIQFFERVDPARPRVCRSLGRPRRRLCGPAVLQPGRDWRSPPAGTRGARPCSGTEARPQCRPRHARIRPDDRLAMGSVGTRVPPCDRARPRRCDGAQVVRRSAR